MAGGGVALGCFTVHVVPAPGSYASAGASSLAAPTAAGVVKPGSTSASVAWTDPSGQPPGTAYEVTVNPGPASCSSSGTSCTLNGLITGTSYIVSVQAVLHSWTSSPATTSFTTPGVLTSALPEGEVGNPYGTLLATTWGGQDAASWMLSQGALPAGLSLDPGTGLITGVPLSSGTASGLVFEASEAGGSEVTSPPLMLTVLKGSQSVIFTTAAPADATVGGSETPAATATSGLSATISVAPLSVGVCALSSGVVRFEGDGTCTLLADQSGDTDWNAASEVTQGFAVNGSAPTDTGPADAPPTDTAPSDTASSNGAPT